MGKKERVASNQRDIEKERRESMGRGVGRLGERRRRGQRCVGGHWCDDEKVMCAARGKRGDRAENRGRELKEGRGAKAKVERRGQEDAST